MEANVRVVPMVPGMRRKRDDDSASTENDSMRPVAEPRRNKRRRTILDAFNSISLKAPGTEDHYEDADSSKAVAEDDVGYTTNSSLEEEDEGVSDVGDNEPMLSDKEAKTKDAERKVMLELVFGPDSTFVPPKNPVDRKLDKLIQNSWKQATTGEPPFETQDDMSLSTAYNSTISSGSEISGGGGLKRSNSLPEIYSQMDTVSEGMEMEDE